MWNYLMRLSVNDNAFFFNTLGSAFIAALQFYFFLYVTISKNIYDMLYETLKRHTDNLRESFRTVRTIYVLF